MKYPTPTAANSVASFCIGVSRSPNTIRPSAMLHSGHR